MTTTTKAGSEAGREAFEAWARDEGINTTNNAHTDGYAFPVARASWKAWQACLASGAAVQEPVAWTPDYIIREIADGRNISSARLSRKQTVDCDSPLYAAPVPRQAEAVLTDEWLEKAADLFKRCNMWPETTGDGFMALLELRNHVESLLAASTPATTAGAQPSGFPALKFSHDVLGNPVAESALEDALRDEGLDADLIGELDKRSIVRAVMDAASESQSEAKAGGDRAASSATAPLTSDSDEDAWAFIGEVAKQEPEAPDYWSTCGQCQRNAERAQDLLEARAQSTNGEQS
jgi:hypothetical protein